MSEHVTASAHPVRAPQAAPLGQHHVSTPGTEHLPWPERFRGMVLGSAVGDALGGGIRHLSWPRIRQHDPRGVRDYLPVFARAGSITDNTQLMLFTLEGLVRAATTDRQPRRDNTNPIPVLVNSYLRWLHTQGVPWAQIDAVAGGGLPAGWLLGQRELFSTRNVGPQLGALHSILTRGFSTHAGNEHRCGACLVRVAPVAAWSGNPREVFEIAMDNAALTDGHRDAHLVSGTQSLLLNRVLHGENIWRSCALARDHFLAPRPDSRAAEAALNLAVFSTQGGRRPGSEQLERELGDATDAVSAQSVALAAVLSTRNFADAVLTAINHSGDSAVAGALCGQLAGALYGADQIPRPWLGRLELREVIDTMCADTARVFSPAATDSEWARRYPSTPLAPSRSASRAAEAGAESPTEVTAEFAPLESADEPEDGGAGFGLTPAGRAVGEHTALLPMIREEDTPAEPAPDVADEHPEDDRSNGETVAPTDLATVEGSGASEPVERHESGEPLEASERFENEQHSEITEVTGAVEPLGDVAPSAGPTDDLAGGGLDAVELPEAAANELSLDEELDDGISATVEELHTTDPGTGTDPAPRASDPLDLPEQPDEWPDLSERTGPDGRDAGPPDDEPRDTVPYAPAEEPSVTDRILGCFLGGALGDALGADDVEFGSIDTIRRRHGSRGVSGMHEAYGIRGAITDDTQMALFTAEGLLRASIERRMFGTDDPVPEVQLAYQRWIHSQGLAWEQAAGTFRESHPEPDGWLIGVSELFATRSPSKTVFRALERFGRGLPSGSFTERVNDSSDCGGIVRAAPAALWSTDPAEVFEVAARAAALTHGHPRGYLPAGALAVIVHQLLRGASLADALRVTFPLLSGYEGHEDTLAALHGAIDLAAHGVPTPELIAERLGGGCVGDEALAIAVCAALVGGEDVRSALRVAVNHSGDSDSAGAVCGNVVGALHGGAGLPTDWLDELELRGVIEQVAMDCVLEFAAAGSGKNPPAGEDWHERYPVRPPWSSPQIPPQQGSSPIFDQPAATGLVESGLVETEEEEAPAEPSDQGFRRPMSPVAQNGRHDASTSGTADEDGFPEEPDTSRSRRDVDSRHGGSDRPNPGGDITFGSNLAGGLEPPLSGTTSGTGRETGTGQRGEIGFAGSADQLPSRRARSGGDDRGRRDDADGPEGFPEHDGETAGPGSDGEQDPRASERGTPVRGELGERATDDAGGEGEDTRGRHAEPRHFAEDAIPPKPAPRRVNGTSINPHTQHWPH